MAKRGFRFIHTGDWHLDEPLHGVVDVPNHLRDIFLNARLRAAEQVCSTAISENVDFVLLAGHILSLHSADANALEFLYGQCLRLRDHGIDVYWHDTDEDQARLWPSSAPLPDNVQVLPVGKTVSQPITRDEHIVACLLNLGSGLDTKELHAGRFRDGGRFTIAVERLADVEGTTRPPIADYWARGGAHQPIVLDKSTVPGGCCGAPQGASPAEPGQHGCHLVTVDGRGRVDIQFIATDVARFEHEQLVLPPDIDQVGLSRLLRDRTLLWMEQTRGRQVFASWTLRDGNQAEDTASDALAAKLRLGGLEREILNALRADFGGTVPGVWTLSLAAEPPTTFPVGWYEEDTVLGDLLRVVQQYQQDPSLSLERGGSRDSLLGSAADLPASSLLSREQLLRQVASLGVDILRGDRVLSDDATMEGLVA